MTSNTIADWTDEEIENEPSRQRAGAPFQVPFDLGDAVPTPRLNLALQGGGAHGAFTWGVLDALLERMAGGAFQRPWPPIDDRCKPPVCLTLTERTCGVWPIAVTQLLRIGRMENRHHGAFAH